MAHTSVIQNTPLGYGLVLVGVTVTIFLFSKSLFSRMRSHLNSVTAADNIQPDSLIHVPIHVPRLVSTSIKYVEVDLLKRRVTSVPNDEIEHLYYVKAQAALSQEMRIRALSWQSVESSDRDDHILRWQNTGIQQNLWNEHREADHSDQEETTPERPLSPGETSEGQQAPETATQSHDILPVRYGPLVRDKTVGDKVLKRPKRRDTRWDMLSEALAEANRAISLDNALEINSAIQAYTNARDILQQVMIRSSNMEDRAKLSSIKNTYSTRIWELLELTGKSDLSSPPPADGPEAGAEAALDGADQPDDDLYNLIDDAVSKAYETSAETGRGGFEEPSAQADYAHSHRSQISPFPQPKFKTNTLATLDDLPPRPPARQGFSSIRLSRIEEQLDAGEVWI